MIRLCVQTGETVEPLPYFFSWEYHLAIEKCFSTGLELVVVLLPLPSESGDDTGTLLPPSSFLPLTLCS